MAVNRRFMAAAPADVFAVLRDGSSYARWVVGTTAVRATDVDWPAPGSRLQYQVGRGPMRKEDETRSVRLVEGVELELEAIGQPLGTARIVIRADPVRDGCLVTIVEHPLRGIAKMLHNPAFELVIWMRNVETLRRLEREVGRRRLLPAVR
jgi:hypothetical protein